LQWGALVSADHPISTAEVETWFRDFAPKHWKSPATEDIDGFRSLLESLGRREPEPCTEFESYQPATHAQRIRVIRRAAAVVAQDLPRLTGAASLLARELPRLNQIARKAVISSRASGVEPMLSRTQLHILECLYSVAAASEDALSAPVFQIEKVSENPRSEWYGTAKAIASYAQSIWMSAGNADVSIGQAATSPVVKITQKAMERIGVRVRERGSQKLEPVAPGTISHMLYEWQRNNRPSAKAS
jgi:hypothetical protein